MKNKLNSCSRAILYSIIVFFFLLSSSTLAQKYKNGYYIKVASGVEGQFFYQKMSVTKNENCWMVNENLLDAYVFVSEKSKLFSLVYISNDVETTYAPSENLLPIHLQLHYEPKPKPNFCRGQFDIGNKQFEVTQSALYYIAADVKSKWITYMPVEKWNIIGTAIPGGWVPKKMVELTPEFSPDNRAAIFSIDSLEMQRGFFQIRFTDGWKITVDSLSENECWNTGSKVFTAFGGRADSLVLGGSNILWEKRGVYSLQLFWDAGQALTASFKKLKDLPMVDYSQYKIGILGDAYDYENGERAFWRQNWGGEKGTVTPTVDGNLYSWHFNNVKLYNGGEFKFRQGNDWSGLAVDFQDITSWSGSAKGDFKNMDSKFHVVNSGSAIYIIVLQIDGTTDAISIIINRVD